MRYRVFAFLLAGAADACGGAIASDPPAAASTIVDGSVTIARLAATEGRAEPMLTVTAVFPSAIPNTAITNNGRGGGLAVGGCEVRKVLAISPTLLTGQSAGRIEVSANELRWELAFRPAERLYAALTTSDDRRLEGALLRVSAPGDEHPAFDVSVASAPIVAVTAPTPSSRLSGALEVRWSPATTEEVLLILHLSGSEASCRLEGRTGTGVIPKETIAAALQLRTSREPSTATLSVATLNSVRLAQGERGVRVTSVAISQVPVRVD